MKIEKANKRDRKQRKRRHGHQEDGRSVKLLQEIVRKKAEEARNQKNHG